MRVFSMFVAFLALVAPAFASGSCEGVDLRQSLSPAEAAALQDRLADMPYQTGNHWQARRGSEVIHLIGTVHLSEFRLTAKADALSAIVTGADRLLLEVTQEDENLLTEQLGSDPDILLLPDTTLPEQLGEHDWQILSQAFQDRGMPPFMAAKFQPWYVSVLLAVPPCLKDTLASQDGLDKRLSKIARAAGVQTQSLEPYDTAFRIFDNVPMETQLEIVLSSIMPVEASQDMLTTILAGYYDERHAESWLIADVLAPRHSPLSPERGSEIFELFTEVLLTQRNKAWIPVLTQASATTKGYVVAAFGAAHLSGKDGVLALLEREGYRLTRLPF